MDSKTRLIDHRTWEKIAPESRKRWQERFPNTAEQAGYMYDEHESAWDRFKDAVKDAWESATGRR